VIRFSAFLVAVAVGLLVAGVVTSKLFLVYLAIGVSGVALLALGIGAAVKWRELFAKPTTAASDVDRPEPVPAQTAQVYAAASASTATRVTERIQSGLPGSGDAHGEPLGSRQADVQRPPAAFKPRPSAGSGAPAPGVWEWRDDSPVPQPGRPVPPTDPGPRPSRAKDQPARRLQPDPEATSLDLPAIVSSDVPDVPAPADPEATSLDLPAVVPDSPAPEPPTPEAPSSDASIPEVPSPETLSAEASSPDTSSPEAPSAEALSPEAPSPEPADPADPSEASPEPPGPDPQTEVTVVPGVPRYHNVSCILIRFMGEGDLEKMTLARARENGCTPCRACLPDQPDHPGQASPEPGSSPPEPEL
jgi:hypothetical protein